MNQNLAASIHNRVSTLCQAYVKEFHPKDWAKLRLKAEDEYLHQARRRNSKADLLAALQTPVVEVNLESGPNTPKTPKAGDSRNYWGDVDYPSTCEEDEE